MHFHYISKMTIDSIAQEPFPCGFSGFSTFFKKGSVALGVRKKSHWDFDHIRKDKNIIIVNYFNPLIVKRRITVDAYIPTN